MSELGSNNFEKISGVKSELGKVADTSNKLSEQELNAPIEEISNLEMGYIFEEIIRKFSEAHNEDAGQHYTPREVIQLMVNILFNDDNNVLSGNNVVKTIVLGLKS